MNLKDYISLYSVETLIKKKQFIPMKNFSSDWQGTDSKEVYQTNLQKQPLDWYYRNNRVKYTLNSKGYRTEEFKKIDWAESVVMFGCSMVYGTGVTDEDTISHNLSKIIDRPVINMGVGGSSISFALHNSLILNSFYPTPKAVIYLWTDYDRCSYYKPDKVIHYGSWNAEQGNFMDNWNLQESNAKVQAIFANMAAKQIWKDKTELVEASYFKRSCSLFNCYHLKHHPSLWEQDGYGRDLIHPGKEAIKRAAVELSRMLKL